MMTSAYSLYLTSGFILYAVFHISKRQIVEWNLQQDN